MFILREAADLPKSMDLNINFGDYSNNMKANRVKVDKDGDLSSGEYPLPKSDAAYSFKVFGSVDKDELTVSLGFNTEDGYDDGSDWGGYSSTFSMEDLRKAGTMQGNKLVINKSVNGTDFSLNKATLYF